MASKQSERRRFYREYRAAGIPFVQAQRLAKMVVKCNAYIGRVEALLGPCEVVVRCPCCGPEGYRFRFGKRVVELTTSFCVDAYWTEA
jgi:hypothetical protein